MQNQPRSPILILIFSFIGMTMRYGLFFCYSIIKGTAPKKFWAFSENFNQMVYNTLLTLLTLLIVFFIYIFQQLNFDL